MKNAATLVAAIEKVCKITNGKGLASAVFAGLFQITVCTASADDAGYALLNDINLKYQNQTKFLKKWITYYSTMMIF